MTTTTPGQPPNGTPPDGHGNQDTALRNEAPPLFTRLKYASSMFALKSMLGGMHMFREWKETRNPPDGHPDLIKTYDCRPGLPIR
jgi:hypothetical protein